MRFSRLSVGSTDRLDVAPATPTPVEPIPEIVVDPAPTQLEPQLKSSSIPKIALSLDDVLGSASPTRLRLSSRSLFLLPLRVVLEFLFLLSGKKHIPSGKNRLTPTRCDARERA